MEEKQYVLITESMIQHLEEFRKKRKMTQMQYAKMIGFSLSGYKGILHGRSNRMTWEHYVRVKDSDPKIYWIACLDGDRFIQIADILDQYEYDLEIKKKYAYRL